MKEILHPFLLFLMVSIFTGFSSKTCDFVGTWDTDWGELTITERWGEYKGSYPVNYGTGYITGKMTKDEWNNYVILKGTWEEGKATGTFELKRYCNKNEFTGTWTNNKINEKGTWKGKKIY